MSKNDTVGYRNIYGTKEFNGLANGVEYHKTDRSLKVMWNDPQLARITRLRLLSDPGFPMWDVSYCHGVMKDGTEVTVELPFDQLPKRNMTAAILKYAKEDKVYVKGIGIFSAISTLN
jgi:hypothetical protein